MILGINVFIYSGNSGTTPIIAAAKSCTISRKCDLIEKASSTQATAKEYIAGREEWEVSIDNIVTTGKEYDGLLKVRGTYTISIVINGQRKTGSAICTQADIKGSVRSVATGSVKFKGTGRLT